MVQDTRELKRAKNVAYRYLALRPRSTREVGERLMSRGFHSDCVTNVIEHLVRVGYLDDERFARDWSLSRVRTRGYGRRRIEQELRKRGIDPDTIHSVVRDLFHEVSEKELARHAAEKKLGTLTRLAPLVRRRRLAGFLERRGFAADIIRAIFRDLF